MKAWVLWSAFVLLVSASYIYIVSVHRVQDFEDIQAVVDTLSSPTLSDRCRHARLGQLRCLPNVIMIGASKCGTTSLVDYLSIHNDVTFVNRRIHKVDKHREIHRFDRNTYGMAMKAVELADEWASSPIVSSENTTVVHYTPHYIYAPTVPFEVKRFYPHSSELKFLVMLRDPVKRAWSSYWFHNSHLLQGKDKGSVDEFLQFAKLEVQQRREYEKCMNMELKTLPFRTLRAGGHAESTPSLNASNLLYLHKLILHLSALHNISTPHSTTASAEVSVATPAQTSSGTVYSLENVESMLYNANKRCFGANLRSPALGTRHIDKGIYIDQLLRWYASFNPTQFYVGTLEAFAREPREQFQDILDFVAVPSVLNGPPLTSKIYLANESAMTVSAGVHLGTHTATNVSSQTRSYDPVVSVLDFKKKRLERPNKLMPELSSVDADELSALYAYYKPYNDLLALINISL